MMHEEFKTLAGLAMLGFLILGIAVTGVERYSKVETLVGWIAGVVIAAFVVGVVGWALT